MTQSDLTRSWIRRTHPMSTLRKKRLTTPCALALFLATSTLATFGAREAQAETRYLKPSALPAVPRSVMRELTRRHCVVPQPHLGKTTNVVRGAFARRGQSDFAVLCQSGRSVSLLIFWSGSARVTTVQHHAVYEGKEEEIGRLGPRDVERFLAIPMADHDGIASGYWACCTTTVHYLRRNKWWKAYIGD